MLIQSRLATRIFGVLLVVVCGMMLGIPLARAEWREPTLPPPQQVFPAPLTTGAENQAKAGYVLIDPVYNPNEQTSLNFDPQRPLDVRGEGGKFSTPAVYSDVLRVDTSTLFVDALADWVGVGTDIPLAGFKLVVDEGTVQVGTPTRPIAGPAVRAYSADSVGLYGDAGATGSAGVYGLSEIANGAAIRGESATDVGVRGESASGIGIYAVSQSLNNAAVYGENTSGGWAGYFEGRLGSVADVIARRFLATYPQTSLVPFSHPRRSAEYWVSTGEIAGSFEPSMVFDGSYVWIGNKTEDAAGNNVYKVRPVDGVIVARYHIEGTLPTIRSLAFDGRYIWATSTGSGDNSVVKFDPSSGQSLAICSTISPDRPIGSDWGAKPEFGVIHTIAGSSYLWTANWDGGDVTKIDSNCQVVGEYPLGTQGTGVHLNRLNDAGYFLRPIDITASKDTIWVLTPSLCGTTPPDTTEACRADAACAPGACQLNPNNLVGIDPDTGVVEVRYATGISDPWKMLFDGIYMWVISWSDTGGQDISKIRVSDGTIMPGYPKQLTFTPIAMAFDGTHLLVSTAGTTTHGAGLYRISVATDVIEEFDSTLSSNSNDGESLYDGKHLWAVSGCTSGGDCGNGANRPLLLTKVFIGARTDHPDLGTVVQLVDAAGTCSVTTARQCIYDWHCPGGETCTSDAAIQDGNIRISGSLTVNHGYCQAGAATYFSRPCTSDAACSDLAGGHCTGGNMRIGSDVDAAGNTWAGSDEAVPIGDPGAGDCPTDGTFVKGITLDGNSRISSFTCRGL